MRSKDHEVKLVEEYSLWHGRVSGGEAVSTSLREPWHLTVARLLPDLHGQRILEIGCGRGDFAIHLANQYPGARISAVDFSPAAIELARSKAARSGTIVDFAADNAESLSFENCSFDFAWSTSLSRFVWQRKFIGFCGREENLS